MGKLLEQIDCPRDLKELSVEELIILAEEIRSFLIEKVAVTGGHLASNLGAVELSLALHYVFSFDQDCIVWDVGHQAYVHKILTGRKHLFSGLRQLDGLSGFPKRCESKYDFFETGHSSTSISAALGMAHAMKIKGEEGKAIAVIGDGSMTAGLALEGLNNAGHLKDDLLVILNDNEMSIAPNVGALSAYFNRLLTTPVYNRFRDDVEELIKRIPNIGKPGYRLTRRIEASLKNLIVPRTVFEEFGFRYFGPIDGHRVDILIDLMRQTKKIKGPVILHAITTKGCGYRPAEENPTRFHGIGSFDPKTGESKKQSKNPTYTQVFGETIIDIARENEKVVAITAAMPDGTGLVKFRETFPERYVDVGIAEQHAVTFAGGLAAAGLRPVVAIYSTFLQRAYDMVIHDVCLQRQPVVFCLDRGGIVGEDGETHQGVFDFAFLRHIPHLMVMAPADEGEFVRMLYTAIQLPIPVVVRYPRGEGQGVSTDNTTPITAPSAEVKRHGEKVLLVAIGDRVYPTLAAAEELAQAGINPTVVNARFVVPLDEELLRAEIERHEIVITVENHVVAGGFGSAINEFIMRADLHPRRVINLGFPVKFIEAGSPDALFARYGLDPPGIAKAVRTALLK